MNIDIGFALETWELGEDVFDTTYPELKDAHVLKHYLSLHSEAENALGLLEEEAGNLIARSEWLSSCVEREAAKL